jgi:hypothetical protein
MAFRHKAAALLNRDKPCTSYDYDESNPSSNPVFQAFEKQLDFILTKKKNSCKKGKPIPDEPECKLYVPFKFSLLVSLIICSQHAFEVNSKLLLPQTYHSSITP